MDTFEDIKEIQTLLKAHYGKVIVDNDFDRAYNIPFEVFDKFDRKDLIEVLFILDAIIKENNL